MITTKNQPIARRCPMIAWGPTNQTVAISAMRPTTIEMRVTQCIQPGALVLAPLSPAVRVAPDVEVAPDDGSPCATASSLDEGVTTERSSIGPSTRVALVGVDRGRRGMQD